MKRHMHTIALGTTWLTMSNATSNQWALQYLDAQSAWKVSTGAHVRVAVVDSGVSVINELGSKLLPGADFSSNQNQSSGTGQVDTDLDGHGTGMASLISGASGNKQPTATIGLAPDAAIIPVRAYATSPAEISYGLVPAVDFAATSGAQVINLSVDVPSDLIELRASIEKALTRDIVVVAAVGNGGDSEQYYPAAYPGVLGVGAIDSDGNVWARSNTGADVGLVAPGVNIYRDDNRGRQGYSDGTSEATAYVSAAAALVRSAHPTWTAPEVVAALIETADKPAAMHGAVRTDQYGYGILDVLAALKLKTPPPVGGSASPDPVKTTAGFGVAGRARAVGGGAGAVLGVAGGILAAVVAGLVALVIVRRRGDGRPHA